MSSPKRQSQRKYRPIRLGICEARSDTATANEAEYSVAFAGPSLSNAVSFLEIFGVECTRSTVHSWVHKADLQPEDRRCPDHVAVDQTVIQLNDEKYWLYAAVDRQTYELLHTQLRPTTKKVIAQSFLTELSEKHDVNDAVFLIDGSKPLQAAVIDMALISDTKNMEIGMLSNVSLGK